MTMLTRCGIGLLLIVGISTIVPGQTAKEDVQSGRLPKQQDKDAGNTKKAAKNTGRKVKKSGKKTANKGASKTDQGADRAGHETQHK